MNSAFAQMDQLPTPPPDMLHALVNYITSPEATAVGWISTVTGVLVSIIALILYFKEKQSNKALQQIFSRFQVAERLQEGLTKTQAEKEKMEVASANLMEEIRKFEGDIKERLPIEAKAAFLKNAIPVIEEQIYALVAQRDAMVASLSDIGEGTLRSAEATRIISAESEVRLSAKRQLDTYQIQLSLLTVSISIVLYVLPYPINRAFAFVLALMLIAMLWKMGRLVRYAYPDAFMARFIKLATKSRRNLFLSFVGLVLTVFIISIVGIVMDLL